MKVSATNQQAKGLINSYNNSYAETLPSLTVNQQTKPKVERKGYLNIEYNNMTDKMQHDPQKQDTNKTTSKRN
jgi:hypothetical protein